MATVPGSPLLRALKDAIAFEPIGDNAGNAAVGRGAIGGRPVHVALVENRTASGSIGTVEAQRLGALFRIVARERSPLVLYLDSAGAKVSEGLKALGAFRRVFGEGLAAALSGAPIAVVVGRNCFGGASMLAHLAPSRLLGAETQLAMSGPSIIAAASGMNVLDEMFRAMAEASISAGARAKANAANALWDPSAGIEGWLREALAQAGDPVAGFRSRHERLGERLAKGADKPAWEEVRRRDVDKLYPEGFELRESEGLLVGVGRKGEAADALLGIVGKVPLGVERAWRFAEAAWRHADRPPKKLRVLFDCATHATRLDDERLVLSEYVVGMSVPLAVLAARGTEVELTIAGSAGGGVYVAMAAPARRVSAIHGARIQMLPGAALAAILGEGRDETATWEEYAAAGVAEEELKLGIL